MNKEDKIKNINIELRKYEFSKEELPTSSFRNMGAGIGEFIPFILAGPGGLQEHKQLNWMNLYLYNKLERRKEVVEVENNLNNPDKLIEAINRLPENLAKIIKPNPEIVLETKIPIELQIANLTKKVEKLENMLESYFEKIGLSSKKESSNKESYTKPTDDMVKNIHSTLINLEKIGEIEYKNNIKINDLEKQLKEIKLIIEKPDKGKEKEKPSQEYNDDYYVEVSREEKDIYSTAVRGLKLRKEIVINYGLKPVEVKNE